MATPLGTLIASDNIWLQNLQLLEVTSDPSGAGVGGLWYRSDTDEFKAVTASQGTVTIPAVTPANVGADVDDYLRAQTSNGERVVPLAATGDAAFPMFQVVTPDGTSLGVHDAATVVDIQTPSVQLTREFDTTDYDAEPNLLRTDSGDIISIVRRGSDHVDNTGKLIAFRSTDGGETYDSGTIISENGPYDERNQSIVYDATADRITVLYRRFDASTSSQIDERVVRSTDGGQTWGTPSTFNSWTMSGQVKPYGGYTETSQGLMTCAYNDNGVLEALFSTDGGQSFGSSVTPGDSSGTSGRRLTEAVGRAMPSDDNDVLIIGREYEQEDSYYIKSTDGGQTWGGVTYFTNLWGGAPLTYEIIDSSTILAAAGERNVVAGTVRLTTHDPSTLFSDPTLVASPYDARMHISQQWQGAAGIQDFAYPSIAPGPDGNLDNALIQAYDSDGGSDSDTDVLSATYGEAAGSTTVTDFESQSLSDWGGDTSDYQFVTSPVFEGSYAIENTANGAGISSTGGFGTYPSPGDIFAFAVRGASGSDTESHLKFATQSETRLPQCYNIHIEYSDGDFTLERRDGSTTPLANASINWSFGTWYLIIVFWGTGGDIAVVPYNTDTGVTSPPITANDSTFTSGGVGMFTGRETGGVETSIYDIIQITDPIV